LYAKTFDTNLNKQTSDHEKEKSTFLQGIPSEVGSMVAEDKEDKETEMIMHKILRIVTSCNVEPVLMLNMMAVALVQVRFL